MTDYAQAECDAIAKLISNLGYTNCDAHMQYSNDSGMNCYISYHDVAGEYKSKWFYGCYDAAECSKKLRNHIATLPTAIDAKAQAFRLQVVKLLELGRELGVETDFLNPLEVMAKKLSENVIEDMRED